MAEKIQWEITDRYEKYMVIKITSIVIIIIIILLSM